MYNIDVNTFYFRSPQPLRKQTILSTHNGMPKMWHTCEGLQTHPFKEDLRKKNSSLTPNDEADYNFRVNLSSFPLG